MCILQESSITVDLKYSTVKSIREQISYVFIYDMFLFHGRGNAENCF